MRASQELRSSLLFNHSCDAELAFVMMLCRLTELNAVRQVFNVCSSPVVQSAWDQGQTLSVHGLAYAVGDGLLKVSSSHNYCLHATAWCPVTIRPSLTPCTPYNCTQVGSWHSRSLNAAAWLDIMLLVLLMTAMGAEASSCPVVTVQLLAFSSPVTQCSQHARHLHISLGISKSRFILRNGRLSGTVDVSEIQRAAAVLCCRS